MGETVWQTEQMRDSDFGSGAEGSGAEGDGAPAVLVEACRRGDPEAFAVLAELYWSRVHSLAFALLRNEASAMDVAQRTFIKVMTGIGRFRGQARFETWLYRITLNAVRDEGRSRRRFVPLGEPDASGRRDPSPGPEREAIQKDLLARVPDAVASLKPVLRVPILLRHAQGLSYAAIAEVLGCSKGTVASRLSRGYRALARRLERVQVMGSLP
jgi:RNA polymerase sigma-70 factor, ECF subfamily